MNIKKIGQSNASEAYRGDWTILLSYNTPVAAYQSGVGFFKTDTYYSVTTTKHINRFATLNASIRPQSFFERLLND